MRSKEPSFLLSLMGANDIPCLVENAVAVLRSEPSCFFLLLLDLFGLRYNDVKNIAYESVASANILITLGVFALLFFVLLRLSLDGQYDQ